MKREIKFKFWLGHTKTMTYAHSLSEINKIIPEFTDDIIPLEFTGLKDKNGKEIYEGDIVRHEFEGEYGPYEHRDTVEYHEGAYYPICEKPGSEFEIIGNIYESPELLTP